MESYLNNSINNIHFVGIGGSSMSGLAEILLSHGYKISGSDRQASEITDKLQNMGIKFYLGHSEGNINNIDLVVYSAAIKADNPELIKAKSLGITSIERSILLGEITKMYPYSIAVSGTHGKTTTTSMVTMIMLEASLSPTTHIGGELSAIGGSIKIGKGDYFITEACEYVDSFLTLHPYIGIILNLEMEHIDYFKSFDQLKASFIKFASQVKKDGYIVACVDDDNVSSLLSDISCKKITYGLSNGSAMWTAKDINYDKNGCASFIILEGGIELGNIHLSIPGVHNIKNALAAAAACHTVGCSIEAIQQGLQKFNGAKKRFEYKGEANGVRVIHDYAHHPTEVKATLEAACNIDSASLWCVFQPHTYTRAKAFLGEFANALSFANKTIVTDIYAAREQNPGDIHSMQLVEKLCSLGKESIYIKDFGEIANYLKKNAKEGDIIITMGAGDINKVGEMFLGK